MAKLWDKGKSTDTLVEKFTVGEDYIFDMNLVHYDILGNIAHARTLNKAGILSEAELKKLEAALRKLMKVHQRGEFTIPAELEDVHTAVENYLTGQLGGLGKKIHTGRSRNDQIIVDMRLYMRDRINVLSSALLDAARTILAFAEKNKDIPMPGFTHTRAAMPSSAGLWSACLAELLLDDLVLLDAAYAVIDQSPLGSAAGYGVPLNLDREFTAKQLGFARVHKNVLAVQNGRGKFELALVSACQQIMIDLSRAAADIILFSMPEFGFIAIPDELTTGSSIMPQKRNPDPMELIRASTHSVNGAAASLAGTLTGLISGYNRDLQLTKGPTMKVLDTVVSSLAIMNRMFAGITVNEKRCIEGFSPDIFAADAALEMVVKQNVPFREAYKSVAGRLGEFSGLDPKQIIKSRKHAGAAGNLGLDAENKRVAICAAALQKRVAKINSAFDNLLK